MTEFFGSEQKRESGTAQFRSPCGRCGLYKGLFVLLILLVSARRLRLCAGRLALTLDTNGVEADQASKCFSDEKIRQPMEVLSTGGFSRIEEGVVYLGSLEIIWASSALHRPFQEACSTFSSEKHLQAHRAL